MQVLIGTSGFSYPAWRGGFYPEKLPETKMLGYYASHFRAVEINNSFYRMPTAEVLGRWAAETPPEFRFALKSPRRITHDKRLSDTASAVERLAEASRALGDKLGPILFQLPPNMKKDLARLDEFLAALPGRPAGDGRVPPRILVLRRRLRLPARPSGRALHRRVGGRRDAAGGDGRLGLPAAAARGLRRRHGRRAGARASRRRAGRRPTSSSSTRTPARGPIAAARLHELMA